ncbi:kinase-like protein [Rhizoclosmatium globosum]|uniref:cAMP-dependent protein kinase n=1 Tax=Rhizoclosmatium globosum TaxID=329046 RepID=A0A1Y2B0V1_9FUNG|nr:kinase-like protein [Rhizoclosmatium globosum]|eukprot:ORY28443.1 kinase-like protein [Rhizoclosmatium globosum]
MAPDILFDKGYMHQIDWWSLGVIFYELFYGKRPFRGPTNADIAKAIKEGVVVFHDANQVTRRPVRISPAFKNLLEGLMVVDRDRRLGCGESGGREVMEHVFFRGGGMLPVFVPDISKPNFDAQEDEAVTGDPMGFRPRQRQNRTELNAWLVNQGAGARTSIPPSPAPTPTAGRGSLAAFLGAAPLEPQAATPPVQQVNPKIVEVTQLLSLAQIKDMHAADPKAPNQERIEAELDFIDANYDVFDWEVLAAQKERERERERGRRGEEVGGFGGDRFGSFGRSKSRSGDDVRGGGVVRGRETPGQTFQRLRSKSIGAMNRAVARGREAVEGGGNGTLDRKKSGVNLRQ